MVHYFRSSAIARIAAPTALLTLATMPVHALESAINTTGGSPFVRIALGLAIVIGLIYACAWAARRTGVGRHAQGGVPMKVVGNLALGPRERILTVEVEDTWVVVGVTPGGMRTLHTLPARPLDAPPPANFMAGLEQALRKRKPAATDPMASALSPSRSPS